MTIQFLFEQSGVNDLLESYCNENSGYHFLPETETEYAAAWHEDGELPEIISLAGFDWVHGTEYVGGQPIIIVQKPK